MRELRNELERIMQEIPIDDIEVERIKEKIRMAKRGEY